MAIMIGCIQFKEGPRYRVLGHFDAKKVSAFGKAGLDIRDWLFGEYVVRGTGAYDNAEI